MAKAKVLLVEDDPLQANETKFILEKSGYEVILAHDGVNAIKMVKAEKPDIILLDVIIPGLDGYEVCRWLKLDDASRGIPIIMLTVKKELVDKISGLQIGADEYLPKPYNELELNARIYALLRTKTLQDELRMKNKQLEDLLQKVEYMAITDSLTSLYNRRRFHMVLNKEYERTKRYATPLTVVMLDIDHFKKVNDKFGHQAGDAVLKETAQMIQKSIRDIDVAFRYGGEEFVIVLPNTEKNDASVVAERMRKKIAEHEFQELSGGHITISIGIAGIPDEDISSEERLIQCADIALYQAKQNGRNRVETSNGKAFKKSIESSL